MGDLVGLASSYGGIPWGVSWYFPESTKSHQQKVDSVGFRVEESNRLDFVCFHKEHKYCNGLRGKSIDILQIHMPRRSLRQSPRNGGAGCGREVSGRVGSGRVWGGYPGLEVRTLKHSPWGLKAAASDH